MGCSGFWRLAVALPLAGFAEMFVAGGEVGQRMRVAAGCGGWWLPYLWLVSIYF